MTIRFEDEVGRVGWNAGTQTVELAWKGFASGEAFRAVLEAGRETLAAHGATRWVGDCSMLGPVGGDDQDWVNGDWFPRLLKAGVQRMAVILTTKTIASMSVDAIMTEVEGTGLVSHYFDDVDAGRRWVVESAQAA